MQKINFTIDGDFVFNGFIKDGDTWNGFLQPYVTPEVFAKIYDVHIKPNIHDQEFCEYFDKVPSLDDQPNCDGLHSLRWGWCWMDANLTNNGE